jgi:hypothetical protein
LDKKKENPLFIKTERVNLKNLTGLTGVYCKGNGIGKTSCKLTFSSPLNMRLANFHTADIRPKKQKNEIIAIGT